MSSYAIMTDIGRNKEAAALATGSSLSIAQIAWGDGDRIPAGGETALLNEVGRREVQGSGQVGGALNTAFFEVLLEANEGPFIIRESGLFDTDGDLVAIARYDPAVNKPKDTVSALLRIHVVFSDLENLILQVQSTDAYVPVERSVLSGAGLTGGGDMSADRTLSVDFASEAEAIAGVADNKVMSPLRVDAAIVEALGGAGASFAPLNHDHDGVYLKPADFPATLIDNGTQALPGGLIIKWGTVTTPVIEQIQTEVFAAEFPNACFAVFGQHINATGSLAGNDAIFQVRSKSKASFDWTVAVYTGGDDGDRSAHWFAIGH